MSETIIRGTPNGWGEYAGELIRCKDCKYAHITYDGDIKYCDIWFPDEAKYLDGDYYCASAERKEDGTDI